VSEEGYWAWTWRNFFLPGVLVEVQLRPAGL